MNNVSSSAAVATHELKVCSVCLDKIFPPSHPEFNGRRIARAEPCKHIFHLECITTWLQNNLTCPLERSLIEVVIEEVVLTTLPLPRNWEQQMVNAAIQGDIGMIRALLNRRAAPDAGQTQGNTPLAQALLNKHPDAALLLVSRGATDPIGLNNLGLLFEYGYDGLPEDLHQAESCYLRAARYGDAMPMHNLGCLYLRRGKDFPGDPQQAVQWLTKAAEKGHVKAMSKLGHLLLNSDVGLWGDRDKALHWLNIAARLNDRQAMNTLNNLIRS
ncbi:SEL1-like repeat protein [Thalassotalea sp. G20_0]|uniref:SEL1-like repeat protein n=1 Tax=Thalassotalea sp. G20_0 TaxID=2821093 RepID=UPI001ADCC16C|nr:SEL1-like repeat protein [Thalassotalea sp. G20_0]MBO9494021.1 SEL1-like repeat protein [Thalassotalea sp. G20_0]